MGLENREYYRDGSYTDRLTGFGLDFTPVVKYLILANVLVFLLQIFLTRPAPLPEFPESFPGGVEGEPTDAEDAEAGTPDEKAEREKQEGLRKAKRVMEQMMNSLPGVRVSVVQEWFALDPEKTVKRGQVWRLVTCAFCHDRMAIWHILFNMLLLYWFGTRLENMYGSREFLLFYLAAAVAASVAYVALALYTGSNTPAIGASGAVMGVMMLYAIFYPFETVTLFWILPVPIWILLSLYVLYDLHPVLLALAGDRLYTGVAHAGHLGGLAFGFVYWRLGLRLAAPFEGDSGPRRRPPVRRAKPIPEPAVVTQPADDSLTEQVDELLRKISEHGQASLTEQEREILLKASARYRRDR